MRRTTLSCVIAALTLWTAACGISADSDDGAADDTDTTAVDVFSGAEWDDDLGTTDGDVPAQDQAQGADDTEGADISDSGAAGSEDASEGSQGADALSPGAVTPGVYVAPDGGVENGYGLRFEVSDDGAVLHSLEADVLETCDGSSTSSTVTVGADLAWDIVDGRFSTRYEEELGGGKLYTTLEGSFSGTTASGIIRQESVVAGSVCDTYALEFTADLR